MADDKDEKMLDAGQVLAKARWLENNSEMQTTIKKMQSRWLLHSMLDEPPLSPTMSRGQAVIVNSPRIMQTKRTLLADILSYTTTVTLNAHIPPKERAKAAALKHKADELEKSVVLAKDVLNDGTRVDRETLDHLLISSYCVWVLECGDCYDDEGEVQWCWTLQVPAPDTCFFPITGGPVRPKQFARRYRQLISESEKKYSGQRYGIHAGKELKRGKDKTWRYEAIGDDRPVTGFTDYPDPEGEFLDAEVVVYYDEEYVYHVMVNGEYSNSPKDSGEVVYCEKHRVKGGPPVVVLSGATSAIRGERLQPFLWAIMQIVKTLNLIDTMRATVFYNATPNVLVEHDPDSLATLMEAGWVRPATTLELAEGGPNIVDIGGKPHMWEIPSSDDMDKLEDKKIAELNDYLNQIQAITSHDVIERSTANGLLLAAGNVETQQGPMLKDRDWAWAQVLQMWLDSVADYDEDFELYAKPGSRHSQGEFEAGEGLAISAADLDGWSWDINITTSNVTAAIQRAKLEDWARGNELHGRPLEELSEVLGYPNHQEWIEMMARDETLKISAAAHAGFVQAAGDADMMLSGGINAPGLKAFWAPPVEPQVQGGGGATNQPMRAPETQGVTGGGVA